MRRMAKSRMEVALGGGLPVGVAVFMVPAFAGHNRADVHRLTQNGSEVERGIDIA